MKSWDTGTSFPENVRADADITAHLQPEVLDALFDAGYYLRHEDMIFDRVFAG
jgi:adenylosuccinate lyase